MTMIVDPLLRARRKVVECDAGWRVTDSEFASIDKALAAAVADELDRVDPLDRTVDAGEARDRALSILDEVKALAEAELPDRDRMEQLCRDLDLLEAHVRREMAEWRRSR